LTSEVFDSGDQIHAPSGNAHSNFRVKVKNLKKIYNDGVAAVNDISFSVKKGEVLALLGPNGAGKSSTFNILTMDLQRSEGGVKLMDEDLDKINIQKLGQNMGICPQFNTLWEELTVDESMKYMASIKGLPSESTQFVLDYVKEMLDLEPFSSTKSGQLSGGNKRKLMCAMSLVACPTIEFLDEPTTGVDPVSRRSLFKMLKNLSESSIVLTTHRMDEAESLCDKISIMVNGRFVCFNSSGELKALYGAGYSISIMHLHGAMPTIDAHIA